MKYYLHDTNSFEDEKITELYMKFGYEGLGLFYTVLEKFAKQEKPIKTSVLKSQLKVGKRLEKCWNFMESLGIIQSSNGESFNERLLNFSEKYLIKKEKNRERISQWRENQALSKNVTRNKSVRNARKDKISKDNISKVKGEGETPTPEVVTFLHPLIEWTKENAPRVMELEQPLTHTEADKLLDAIPEQEVKSYLLSMHNYKDLKKKSVSAYLTLLKWRKRDADRQPNQNKPSGYTRPLGRGEVTADYVYEGWVRAYGKERADALVREHSRTGKVIS